MRATAFLILAVATSAFATSFVPPQKRDVYSPNKEYFVRVDPQRNKLTVYRTTSPKRALWSIERPIWLEEYFISDSGSAVVFVAWEFVRTDQLNEPALIVYTSEGIALSKTYKEISKPRRIALNEVGPIGSFWRIWKEKNIQTPDSVKVSPVGRDTVTVTFETKNKEG